MTENEAIEILNYFNEKRKEYNKSIRNACPYFNEKGYQNFTNSIEMAMSALYEIQQYRAIGTVKQIERGLRFIDGDDNSGIIEDLRELHKYYLIGTVEECREARERRRGQEPNKRKLVGTAFTRIIYHCPNCNKWLYDCAFKNGELDHVSPGSRKSKFCEDCGQKLYWSE